VALSRDGIPDAFGDVLRIPLQASMSVSPSFRLQEATNGPWNVPQYDLASLIGIRG